MNLDHLAQLATEATPKHWHDKRNGLHMDGTATSHEIEGVGADGRVHRICASFSPNNPNREADAAYIAAFNPEVVKRLLDVVEAAKALKDVMSSTDRFDWPMSGNVRAGYDDLRGALAKLDNLGPK